MITGEVNAQLEPVVSVRLRGTNGAEISLNAIVDTGFTAFLTLPRWIVSELDLSREDYTTVRLGDGSLCNVEIVEGSIWWQEHWRRIPIQVSETDPLLGMALLKDQWLAIEVIENGEVSIEPCGSS